MRMILKSQNLNIMSSFVKNYSLSASEVKKE